MFFNAVMTIKNPDGTITTKNIEIPFENAVQSINITFEKTDNVKNNE